MQSDWDTLCDLTDELMATGCYASRHDAMKDAQRRNPHLDATPPGTKPAARPAMGNAEQQLNAAARQIAAARHITFAQAYVVALAQNPHLYQEYLAQHPQQTGGARG